MSKINDEQNQLEGEVVKNELPQVEEVQEVETVDNKTKVISVAKTVGKAALVAGVGIIGYLFGYRNGKNSNDYEEIDDYEVIDNNDNQN